MLKILGLSAASIFGRLCPADFGDFITDCITSNTSTSSNPNFNHSGNSTAIPACVVRPELTEGPYFVDEMLNRSDIRSDPSDSSVVQGAQLDLAIDVTQIGANGCKPLPNAQVDMAL